MQSTIRSGASLYGRYLRSLLLLLLGGQFVDSFTVSQSVLTEPRSIKTTTLFLAKKKRRRRKDPPSVTTPEVPSSQSKKTVTEAKQEAPINLIDSIDTSTSTAPPTDEELAEIRQVANFAFEADDALMPPTDLTESRAIPLPDIRQARKIKQQEQALREKEEEEKKQKVKIKRSDTESFRKLLEQQPYADADDSFFEEEEYGTVSALLGERAKPFLGIPFGPLQVGHFIGALGIILMAFVEYPGFPLTNLPSPLRGCFQGGLFTIYSVNIVLAVIAAFKAPERGQPVNLWVAKTIAVGGLAYDQLTQLPTTKELERANSVKGRRAVKQRSK